MSAISACTRLPTGFPKGIAAYQISFEHWPSPAPYQTDSINSSGAPSCAIFMHDPRPGQVASCPHWRPSAHLPHNDRRQRNACRHPVTVRLRIHTIRLSDATAAPAAAPVPQDTHMPAPDGLTAGPERRAALAGRVVDLAISPAGKVYLESAPGAVDAPVAGV